MLDSLLDTIKNYYLELLPFNRVLGICIDRLEYETCEAVTSFSMRPELVGNSIAGILHGGVTASVIDLTGGLSALVSCVRANQGAPLDELKLKLAASATINMQVDYLRPGKGNAFECRSRVARVGSRIVVSKIDLFNDSHTCIATGTGTYMIG